MRKPLEQLCQMISYEYICMYIYFTCSSIFMHLCLKTTGIECIVVSVNWNYYEILVPVFIIDIYVFFVKRISLNVSDGASKLLNNFQHFWGHSS